MTINVNMPIYQMHSQQILNYDEYSQQKLSPCKKIESSSWIFPLNTDNLKLSTGLNELHPLFLFVNGINSQIKEKRGSV